jgi:hypothetical protein
VDRTHHRLVAGQPDVAGVDLGLEGRVPHLRYTADPTDPGDAADLGPAGFWVASFVLIHCYSAGAEGATHIVFERVQFAVNLIYCGYMGTKNGPTSRSRAVLDHHRRALCLTALGPTFHCRPAGRRVPRYNTRVPTPLLKNGGHSGLASGSCRGRRYRAAAIRIR